MCGRYALFKNLSPDELAKRFGIDFEQVRETNITPRFNIAPLQSSFILNKDKGERELVKANWGLVPSWAKDNKKASMMINARGETVHEKPSFRTAFKRRRCVVPANAFYEWQGDKKARTPLRFHKDDDSFLLFAGLYEYWQPEPDVWRPTFTIITTAANDFMSSVHDRMPVILPDAVLDDWLNPDNDDIGMLRSLLVPAPEDLLIATPASPKLNTVKIDDPSVLDPDA